MIIKVNMYLSIVRLVQSSVLLLIVLFSCSRNTNSVVSANIYSLDWLMTTRADLSAEDVMNWDGDELRKFKIEDKNTLDFISQKLRSLKPMPEYHSVDTRMVCVLHYSDGGTEKLQFGGTQLLLYKEVVYDRDSLLVQRIENVYTKEPMRVSFKINRIISDDETQFAYKVEITQGSQYVIADDDLIKELKNTEPGKNGITFVKKVSPSIWNIKTNRH